jgi:hypothetical protein
MEIVKKREENEAMLKALGPSLPRSHNEKFEFMWKMNEDLVSLLINEIQGKYDPNRSGIRQKESDASAGYKIRSKFDDFLFEYVKPDFKVTKDYTNANIEHANDQYSSVGIPGFPSIGTHPQETPHKKFFLRRIFAFDQSQTGNVPNPDPDALRQGSR